MRRIGFIQACLVILLSACTKTGMDKPGSGSAATGQVQICLSADANNEVVGVRSSSVEEVSVDDFWIEIFTSSKTRIYCKKYSETKDAVLNLNTGEYRLLAKYGDTLGVGFNHAFYMADKNFTVEQKKGNTVEAVAKLSNVKAKVNFGEKITNTNYFADCYVLLKNTRIKTPLKFLKNETRPGYIPAGDLVLEVYAKIGDSYWYWPVPAKEYFPNDFITFNVEAYERSGDLGITIKIDDSLTDMELETIELPADQAHPTDLPLITPQAFTNGNYTIVEDAESDSDLEVSVSADAGMTSFVVEVQSEALDVPASFDLLNLDDATKTKLENAGFVWHVTKNKNLGVVDFESVASYIAKNMPYDETKDTKESVFKITITDKYDRTASETVKITWEVSAKSTVSAVDYNIWGSRIVNPTVTFTKGDPSESELQYSVDGTSWTSLGKPVSVSGNTAVYNTATGLTPGAACQFRVVYKGFFPRGKGSIVTEAPQQLGNSGFENWFDDTHTYNRGDRAWYRPWAQDSGDKWWDVNSKKTLLPDVSTAYQHFKCVPTVYKSADAAQGSFSAQLLTTAVGTNADETSTTSWFGKESKAAGEIFIGTSDANGNHASEGHAFSSRPASLSFSYKYLPYPADDMFHVYVSVFAADGTKIGEANSTAARADGSFTLPVNASSGWARTTVPLPITYTVHDKKAAKIYVCIRTTEKADSAVEYKKQNISVIGSEKGYVGSILYLDDLKLNY